MAAMFDRDAPSNMKKPPPTVVCMKNPSAVQKFGAPAWLRSLYEKHEVIGGECLQLNDRAYAQIDRAFDLPNRTINLLIQWIHQNNCSMPERRRIASELLLLKPQHIDRIEAIVADCFSRDEGARNDGART